MNNTPSPSVTLVLLCYSQEHYIAESVRSALSQDFIGLKIIISDDASPDDTFEVACGLVDEYTGPHQVVCRQNEVNLGLTAHLNMIMAEVDTELVVVAAGDDNSLPHRVSRLVDAYINNGRPQLLSSMAFRIDNEGCRLEGLAPAQVINIHDYDAVVDSLNDVNHRVGLYLGASGAWTMALWNKFGPINHSNCWEDVVMGFRAAVEGSYYHIDEPLLEYRVGIGLSTQTANGIKEKILSRKKKVLLKRDLARQRYDDLSRVFHDGEKLRLQAVQQQKIKYDVLSSLYISPSSVLDGLKEKPAFVTKLLILEVGIVLIGVAKSFFAHLKSSWVSLGKGKS